MPAASNVYRKRQQHPVTIPEESHKFPRLKRKPNRKGCRWSRNSAAKWTAGILAGIVVETIYKFRNESPHSSKRDTLKNISRLELSLHRQGCRWSKEIATQWIAGILTGKYIEYIRLLRSRFLFCRSIF